MLQLGGNEPAQPSAVAIAAAEGEAAGYCEINLNCGCPSDRVASGAFGACLMREPALVAECVAAMRARVRVPITVKMRIGVVERKDREGIAPIADFNDGEFDALQRFVAAIADAGCARAIVHARKAVLGGLSPKENRAIPPLRYDIVRELKRTFSQLPIVVNGGFRDTREVLDALAWSDGVMLGREAYHRPFVLSGATPGVTSPECMSARRLRAAQCLSAWSASAERELAHAERALGCHHSTPMPGLYGGQPGARWSYRRILSQSRPCAWGGRKATSRKGQLSVRCSAWRGAVRIPGARYRAYGSRV